MKVIQKVTRSDGSSTETEYRMEMEKGRSNVCWTLTPTNDEPIAVRIIEAGWRDQGEKTYHVLTEWGAYEETSYSYLNQSQLLERFPDFQHILAEQWQDVMVSGLVIKSLPNDGTLGKHVRAESIFK